LVADEEREKREKVSVAPPLLDSLLAVVLPLPRRPTSVYMADITRQVLNGSKAIESYLKLYYPVVEKRVVRWT
jgi:hypothetical protein